MQTILGQAVGPYLCNGLQQNDQTLVIMRACRIVYSSSKEKNRRPYYHGYTSRYSCLILMDNYYSNTHLGLVRMPNGSLKARVYRRK